MVGTDKVAKAGVSNNFTSIYATLQYILIYTGTLNVLALISNNVLVCCGTIYSNYHIVVTILQGNNRGLGVNFFKTTTTDYKFIISRLLSSTRMFPDV